MGIEKYDIIDHSFSKTEVSSYNLSILIGIDRFIYSITNANNKLLVLKTNLFEGVDNYVKQKQHIQETIKEDELLTLTYSKVVIGVIDRNSTLVPSDFYEERNLKSYFKTLLFGNNLSHLQADSISSMNTHHLYEINKEIKNQLLTFYPQANLVHLNSAFLKYLGQLDTTKKGSHIYINTIAYTLSAFVFKEGKLLMVNCYQFKSTKDYFYFIMLIFNQFDLDKSNTTIHLGGELAKGSQVVSLLKKYYPSIEFMDRPHQMKWPNQFLNTPDHYFTDLFSLTLCA